MESRAIAATLEKEFPSPSLYLDSPILPTVEALMPKVMLHLPPVYLPRVPRDILNERSISYFNRTREARFSMPLDEFEKSEKGGEHAWENATPHLRELAELLKEGGGPFFMGQTVSYADFIVVGFLHFMKCLSYNNDLFNRVVQIDQSFLALYEACAEWLKRDDY
jgi:glutathione S-transferase